MLKSMLLGDPQPESSVSVSSLLNKADKMPSADITETVTVKETSIIVQETASRGGDDDDEDDFDVKRAASVDLASDRSPRLPPSPKSAEDEAPSVVDTESAQAHGDTDREPTERVSATPRPASEATPEATLEATPGATPEAEAEAEIEKTQPDEPEHLVNGNGNSNDDNDNGISAGAGNEAQETSGSSGKADGDVDTSKQDGDVSATPASASAPATASASAPADNVFEIERLASHRVNKETSTVDFFVEWVGTATSWEPERELQLQVPDLVFEYWEAQGGREKATGLEEFHVFRILDSTVDPPLYRVQWVGYRDTPADTTWEPKSLLRRVAPIALGLYESSNKKRTTKGKPGRPSKKAKTSKTSAR